MSALDKYPAQFEGNISINVSYVLKRTALSIVRLYDSDKLKVGNKTMQGLFEGIVNEFKAIRIIYEMKITYDETLWSPSEKNSYGKIVGLHLQPTKSIDFYSFILDMNRLEPDLCFCKNSSINSEWFNPFNIYINIDRHKEE